MKKILIKMFSVFFALALVNSSVTLAKVKQKSVEQADEEKLSPKEQKEKDIKTIKEFLKKSYSFEEQMREKMLKKFKNFKKEDYELKDYDLRVLKKANAPILFYTHKKTGAQVYFNLVLDKERLKNEQDSLTFRVPCKDDRGLKHFMEHCLEIPILTHFTKNKKSKRFYVNAFTTLENLNFVSSVEAFELNEQLEKEYIEKLTKELTKPSVFEKENKIFEIEKKRILNEEKDREGLDYNSLEEAKAIKIRDFNIGGKVLELEKITLNDLKNFYEKYIHPSNCLLIKNVFELNSQKIKDYLNLWNEKYFSRFEKKETKGLKYEPKNKEKYILKNWAKDSIYFNNYDYKGKRKKFNYFATIDFDSSFLNAKQKEFFVLKFYFFEKELDKFIKSLGYENLSFREGVLRFFGNDKKNFTQKALEKNSKKIMEFISEKLKVSDEEEFIYKYYNFYKYFKKSEIEKFNLKNNRLLFSLPNIHLGDSMSAIVEKSFNETGNAISDKFFMFKDKDELEDDFKAVDKYMEKVLKGDFNVYKKLAEKGPKYINVLEKNSKKTLEQFLKKDREKYEIKERFLPIKFKEKKPKKFVKDFAVMLFANSLEEELEFKQGLIYKPLKPAIFFEDEFLIRYLLNKDSCNALEDFVFKNFNEIMKNVELKESNLIEAKKQFKKRFEDYKAQYEGFFKNFNVNGKIRDFKKYIKTKKADENSSLKVEGSLITIGEVLGMFYPGHLINTACYSPLSVTFENFKEYEESFEKEMSIKEKYVKRLEEKINPEFIKEFLENLLNPTLKILKKAYKLAEEKLKALDSIKLLDLENLVKTAYLVEDKKEVEKVNQNLEKRAKRIEDYLKKRTSF